MIYEPSPRIMPWFAMDVLDIPPDKMINMPQLLYVLDDQVDVMYDVLHMQGIDPHEDGMVHLAGMAEHTHHMIHVFGCYCDAEPDLFPFWTVLPLSNDKEVEMLIDMQIAYEEHVLGTGWPYVVESAYMEEDSWATPRNSYEYLAGLMTKEEENKFLSDVCTGYGEHGERMIEEAADVWSAILELGGPQAIYDSITPAHKFFEGAELALIRRCINQQQMANTILHTQLHPRLGSPLIKESA